MFSMSLIRHKGLALELASLEARRAMTLLCGERHVTFWIYPPVVPAKLLNPAGSPMACIVGRAAPSGACLSEAFSWTDCATDSASEALIGLT